MSSDSKRRRVGEGGSSGGDGIPPVGGNDHQNDNTSVHRELSEMKSIMNDLMNQNRTQAENISSMLQMMQSQSRDINQLTQANDTMQGDINRLTQKCHSIETSILDNSTATSLLRTTCDRIEDKQKYHERLLQNQKWVYSAPRPSGEYWSSLDDEDEFDEVEDFLKQIQQCTEEMRYGTGNGEIEISTGIGIPYNEEFLPHWKEFANALKQYHYHLKQTPDILSSLDLWNMELPDKVIDLLSNAFESTYFQKIDLRNNNFGQKGMNFTLKYLKSNRNLKEFCLEDNPIDNITDIKKLCKIIRSHPSTKTLHLIGCRGDNINGYEMLKMIMNAGKTKLEEINLSNNRISATEGGTFISDFLATNPCLENLYLDGNCLNDNDAVSIAESLKQNHLLSFLDLTNNNLTKTGWMALRKAEFNNTSLNAAADSNHTCNIKYPPDGSALIEAIDTSEMNGDRNLTLAFDPTWVRRKKIYKVSSRNRELSNVEHFDDIHVKLLPKMLSSIQEYSNYQDDNISQDRGHVHPLSIVYEICRNWEESIAVFEALSS